MPHCRMCLWTTTPLSLSLSLRSESEQKNILLDVPQYKILSCIDAHSCHRKVNLIDMDTFLSKQVSML